MGTGRPRLPDPFGVTPRPSTTRHLAREILRLDRSQISLWMAARNAVGVAAPLALGVALGRPDAGLTLAVGALNVAFSDGHDPYRARAGRMSAAAVLSALSVFIGATVARHDLLAILVAAAWAFVGGMIVLLGPVAGQIGITTLVLVIVFGAEPMPAARAAAAAALVCAGGLWQTVLSLGSWPTRGLAPERRTLAAAWRALAGWARAPADAHDVPPATVETTAAAGILDVARADHGPATEALVSLYNQLERSRLALVSLAEQRRRWATPAMDTPARAADAVLAALGDAYDGIAGLLEPAADPSDVRRALRDAVDRLDRAIDHLVHDAPAGTELGIAVRNAHALAGQVRAAAELGARLQTGGRWESLALEPSLPAALRIEHVWPRLRANFTIRSAAFRHAVRLAACVALGEWIRRGAGLPHGYWIPMTVAIVLKPDFTATFSRGIARVAGTLVGLVVASLAVVAASTAWAWVAFVAVLVFLMRGLGRANYLVFAAGVTALIVVLFALVGAPPIQTMEARTIATVAGGAMALAAYALWPTWERTQTPLALADLLDAYRAYFAAIGARADGAGSGSVAALRGAARLARTNAEASVDRLRTEPNRSAAELDLATRMLAASRRFARQAMVVEAALADRGAPTPPIAGLDDFVRDVGATLRALAARLRREPVDLAALPDLREEQLALRAGGAGSGTEDAGTAWVVMECDRIANAVNTITALVREMDAGGDRSRPTPAARQRYFQ